MNILKEIWTEINKHTSVVIMTHINPDGDTIGSAVALKNLILDNTKIKEVYISGEPYPRNLNFLEPNDQVSDEKFNKGLKIVVDTASPKRIHDKRIITKETILIDHHHEEGEWLMGIAGDNYPATGEIIYNLAKENNLVISDKAADGIFVAIWTDTEEMTERNPSQATKDALEAVSKNKGYILSKLAPNKEEQELIDELSNSLKVEDKFGYAIFEKYIPNDIVKPAIAQLNKKNKAEITFAAYKDEVGTFRMSFRSKGNFDVSKVASHFGGGGHFSSAGAKANTIERVHEVLEYLKRV